ncbi:sigma-54 interaction domain-containing protein [Fictibacillus terranigra]|uniref:HTH-type transcriptional regulatory protein TyrR n=1 Tax=Fictibacillus terranigra TaxID=3058424 RepID=A0ABT8EC25_9BACL|nr:sigma 54-interacting transcriptional regulator [Fictibacillus sp. CENA-BCM004]MDN4075468.1 sigma 54-interacting transcriptional regulator [Fictibacillus sp. CENA-BCM004]
MKTQADMFEIELNAILQASKDNIVIADGKGTVLRASPNCTSIYGKDSASLIGKSVFELEAENTFSPSVTVKVLKENKEVQVMQQTPTGRTVMATGLPVRNESGEIIRVISFSTDLTEIQHLKEDFEELQTRMEQYQTEIQELRGKDLSIENLVLQSKAIRQIWQLVQRVAKSDASVVFLGESGVGKNVFTRALHQGSDRKKEPFIEVNCGAIPEALFESEMFGYEAGSFTGANRTGKAGFIELADKGTLFLDEVGELPLSVQAKLLMAIQEKKVARVGGLKAKSIDFRLIASTNQDLAEMVRQGKFRQDLYYRLNVIPITIPPLRERREDIPLLAHFYLQKTNEKYGMNKFFHSTAIEKLVAYDWPGNVRELQNMMERLVVTAETRTIYPDALPFTFQHDLEQQAGNRSEVEDEEKISTLKEALEEVEIRWLKRATRQCITTYEMAKYLGLNQSNVVRKLKKYNIDAKTHLNAIEH